MFWSLAMIDWRQENMLAKDVDGGGTVKGNCRFQDFSRRWIVIRTGRMVLKKLFWRQKC